ncbi:MAG: DUF448 domain-containing protein [Candidatus Obscuribacterales bacterium]|nr:DUF448 domain-containing protein [Candidatus Obscuribacterales bacterium]
MSCRAESPQTDLIRLTVDFKTGQVVLNQNNKKLFGRSAYLCKKEACLTKLKKGGRLKYALEGRRGKSSNNYPKRQVNLPLESQLIKAIADLCTDSGKTCQNTVK